MSNIGITAVLKTNVKNVKKKEAVSSAPLSLCPSQKSRSLLLFLYFSKHYQLDLFKASGSISYHLTSIFPENFWVFWSFMRGSHGLSAQRARRTKSRPGGPQTSSPIIMVDTNLYLWYVAMVVIILYRVTQVYVKDCWLEFAATEI